MGHNKITLSIGVFLLSVKEMNIGTCISASPFFPTFYLQLMILSQ